MNDALSLRVAARYASELEEPRTAQLEQAATKVPAVRGALVVEHSQPRAGIFDVTIEAVLHVAAHTDTGPTKFKGSLGSIGSALTRELKRVGGSKIQLTPPQLTREKVYDGDTITISVQVSDAPV